jgi:lycopene cyclase domain-containing protein
MNFGRRLTNDRISLRLQLFWWISALLIVLLLWELTSVSATALQQEVEILMNLPWLESSYAYLYLHIFSLLPVLALSFDRKVHFYRYWKYLFPAIGVVGFIFIVWDQYFTHAGVWGFNSDYLTGWYLMDLPVEELLFFFTVPYACIFTYECLRVYLVKDPLQKWEPYISPVLGVAFLAIGIVHLNQIYTATTFLMCAAFQGFHLWFYPARWRSRFYLGYGVTLIPFLLVNGVLTGGFTEAPIVQYNPDEYLGLRLGSIPVDDMAYGYLLLFSCTTLFEIFRKRAVPAAW